MDLRMPDLNQTIIAGRIGREPEMKYTATNMAVAGFSLAFERRVKKGDAWESETSWITCNAFDKTAERIAKLAKGMPVIVEGNLKEEKWEKDGQKRSALKLIVNRFTPLAWEDKTSAATAPAHTPAPPAQEDDIPF